MISPAVANYVWPDYPQKMRGVRIHASLNSMEALLLEETELLEFS